MCHCILSDYILVIIYSRKFNNPVNLTFFTGSIWRCSGSDRRRNGGRGSRGNALVAIHGIDH